MSTPATPSSPGFIVNTQTAGDQLYARMAGLAGGGYVVTWTDYLGGTPGDNNPSAIKAQVFDASDNRIGTEFFVATSTPDNAGTSSIASLSNGGFVITWQDSSHTLGDASGQSVEGQVFNAQGNKVGSAFLVNTNTAGDQTVPQVTGLINGGFAVAWTDASGTLGDASFSSVKAQVFDNLGTKVGTEFLVNTNTPGDQNQEQISALTNGNFVVTWRDESGTLGDSSGFSVKGQVFDALGHKVGSEFLVNTDTSGDQSKPSVAGLSGGGFVVAWADARSLHAQLFDSAGHKTGAEFLMSNSNDTPLGIAALSDGGFVVSEVRSFRLGPGDTGSYAVQVFDSAGNKNGSEIGSGSDPHVGGLTNDTFVIAGVSGGSFGLQSDISAQHFKFAPSQSPVVANPIPDQFFPEDTGWTFQFAANTFVDPEGDSLTYSAQTSSNGPLPGWLTFNASTRTFRGAPPLDFNGTVSVKVAASDGHSTTFDTFDLTITPVNDAPVAQNGSASGKGVISGALVATDVDGDHLLYGLVAQASHGIVGVDSNGIFTYTPAEGYTGTDSFTYKANDGSLDSNTATISLTIGAVNPGQSRHDFNGDDRADILWHTDGGTLAIWQLDGTRINADGYVNNGTVAVGTPGPDWHIVDAADFDGDGKNDILWRTDSGSLAIWEMDGARIKFNGFVNNGTIAVGAPGPDWHVTGTADFDGDGKNDILWRTDSGSLAVWEMDGTRVKLTGFVNDGTAAVDAPGPDWHVADAADFDGDHKGDILWRTDSGSLAIWEMDGTHVKLSGFVNNGTEAVGAPGPDWHVADTADFDGDGKNDILWRTDSGSLAIWEMDGTRIKFNGFVNNGTIAVGAPGPDWHIADTADFDGDGKSDILWRTDSGSVAIWEMDGTHIKLSGYVNNGTDAVGAPGPDWHIVMPHYDLV